MPEVPTGFSPSLLFLTEKHPFLVSELRRLKNSRYEREKVKIAFHEYLKKIARNDRLPRGKFFKGKLGLNCKIHTFTDELAEIAGGLWKPEAVLPSAISAASPIALR